MRHSPALSHRKSLGIGFILFLVCFLDIAIYTRIYIRLYCAYFLHGFSYTTKGQYLIFKALFFGSVFFASSWYTVIHAPAPTIPATSRTPTKKEQTSSLNVGKRNQVQSKSPSY